jgi:hypothetical protein
VICGLLAALVGSSHRHASDPHPDPVFGVPLAPRPAPTHPFRTFFIDYESGSEANSGTSPSTPWQRAPGMQGCIEKCAEYKAKPGDHFVFKGGVTWPNGVFPLVVRGSGAAGDEDYYGVTASWHTGASYSPPVFDAEERLIEPEKHDVMMWFHEAGAGEYVTVEGIHFENWTATGAEEHEGWWCDALDLLERNHITLDHILVTNWSVSWHAAQGGGCDAHVIRTSGTGPVEDALLDSTIEGKEGDAGDWAVRCMSRAEGDVIGKSTGLLEPCPNRAGVAVIANNRLFDCGYPAWPPGIGIEGNPAGHADAMQSRNTSEGVETDYVYDNVIEGTGGSSTPIYEGKAGDTGECEAFLMGGTNGSGKLKVYMWNNVLVKIHGNAPQMYDNVEDFYSWNNSLEGGHGGTEACQGEAVTRLAEVVFKNNLCLSRDGGGEGIAGRLIAQSRTAHVAHNVVIGRESELAAAHYATPRAVEAGKVPYVFAPTSALALGVDRGERLSVLCSNALASLCADTTYGDRRTPTRRPAKGAWDIGAYQHTRA